MVSTSPENQTRIKTEDNHHNDDDSLIPQTGKRFSCKQAVCKFTSTNTNTCITIQITAIPLHLEIFKTISINIS